MTVYAATELVVEEALVNICHYAYRNKVGNMEVRCNRDAPISYRHH
jgi:anti-sigma regulatory factor (Ser/Thr protein kinase)